MSINSNLLAYSEETLLSENDPAFIGPRLEKPSMVNRIELPLHGSPNSITEDIEMEEVEPRAMASPLVGVKDSDAAPPSQVSGSCNLTAIIQTLTKQVEQIAAAITGQEHTGKQFANLSREYTVAVKTGRMFSYFAYKRCGLLHFLVYSNVVYTIRKSKLWVTQC